MFVPDNPDVLAGFPDTSNNSLNSMNSLRCISKIALVSKNLSNCFLLSIARRCFSEGAVVKIVSDEIPKAVSTVNNTTVRVEEPTKPVKEQPKVEKEAPKKKRSSFRPFLYGCAATIIAGYFYLYKQIWKSAHQMEQTIADISVDISETTDHLEQRVARLESLKE